MARIRVAIRHLYKEHSIRRQTIAIVGGLKIDLDKRLLLHRTEVHVTPMEYSHGAPVRNVGRMLTTGALIRELYGLCCGHASVAYAEAGLRLRSTQPSPGE